MNRKQRKAVDRYINAPDERIILTQENTQLDNFLIGVVMGLMVVAFLLLLIFGHYVTDHIPDGVKIVLGFVGFVLGCGFLTWLMALPRRR